MAANRPVWGIDLGQSALKAIRLRVAGDGVEAVDYAYIEHGRILSQPDANRQALITETVKKFVEAHNLSKEVLFVGVPGQHTLARFTKLPPVDKKKIPEIVKYEAQQQIPFDMEEVIWDYQVFQSGGGTETEVGIFAMRRELLRDHLSFLSSLNLEPAGVQSNPLALYNAMRFDGLIGSEAAVILDIGAQNSDLIIADGETLWTRNIPIGGNNFTEALLKTFKLSFNKAENLKRTAASSKYARQIFQAMRPVFADLVAEVQRSIGFFTSSRRGVKLGKVIAMGNAFQLPGMVKFVQQNLGMEVVRPTAFSKLNASQVPNAPDLLKQFLSFGVAYGLALQGLGKAQITSNLLPPEIAQQVVWRKKTPWFYGAAACLLLSAGLVWSRNMVDAGEIAKNRGENQTNIHFSAQTEQVDGVEIPVPSPEAYQVVEQGPSQSEPLGYANAVTAASSHLGQVVQQLKNLNDEQRQRVEEALKLQSFKPIWPKILHRIHSSLPPMEPELAAAFAAGPEALKTLVASNPDRYARPKRRQIFIEQMQSQYSTDLGADYQAAVGGADQPGRAGALTGGADMGFGGGSSPGLPLTGFLVTIDGRTTSAEGCGFVNNTFITNLRRPDPSPALKGIYIDPDRVYLGRCRSARQESPLGTNFGGLIRPRAGDGGFGTGFATGEIDTSKDPVTGESMQEDIVFQIILAVVVGEPPAQNQPAAAPMGDNDGGF
ncbi:MAG: hypothetical protein AMXMBFR13_27140 [Phycisphaerae bacterium]